MPRRNDLSSILIIGAGPIVIGQACEFDYSGVQACKALRDDGYRVILINSNPATIMTDPGMADVVYVEPIRWQTVAAIIAREKPDALLPTMGGQTALNTALELATRGILSRHGVELIGASSQAIEKAENRELFKAAMQRIGLEVPHAAFAHTLDEALLVAHDIGFPVIVRPSFTLGGSGGGVAVDEAAFRKIAQRGLAASPTTQVSIEPSLVGWKEFEMEVVRDHADNCIIVCAIENVDPMGVHTGDSITVAPTLTLTDREYQRMRDASLAVIREIGVDTGGSNVQFGLHPTTGQMVVIEMNPRVSRSSALASKATGFPIAKVAAKLAVGYTLDELSNTITGATPASFEPAIDYVVTKLPRFTFEKFPQAPPRLTTQMKSVGEVMAIGRTFTESYQKALRGLEVGIAGAVSPQPDIADDSLAFELENPGPMRARHAAEALRRGWSVDRVADLTGIDPWFVDQILAIVEAEQALAGKALGQLARDAFWQLKRRGFADARIAELLDVSEREVRQRRRALGVTPVFKRVDTCAGEFEARTPYMYSTYASACEAATDRATQSRGPWRGSKPHRARHRIRLLLRPCGAGAAR